MKHVKVKIAPKEPHLPVEAPRTLQVKRASGAAHPGGSSIEVTMKSFGPHGIDDLSFETDAGSVEDTGVSEDTEQARWKKLGKMKMSPRITRRDLFLPAYSLLSCK